MIAAVFGQTEVIVALAELGADLDLVDSVSACCTFFAVAFMTASQSPELYFKTRMGARH